MMHPQKQAKVLTLMNSSTGANRPAFKPATTVTKVCRVIEEMKDCKSISINELARKTSLLPSDIHRILTSLRASEFVDQDPETRQYRLGLALLRVGLSAFQRNQFREKAHPALMRLSQETGATVHLGILDEKELEVTSRLPLVPSALPIVLRTKARAMRRRII
jgi:DNA-binding IclR family transcriptional regulator